jgi:Copper binding periplasmic protein CusF
MRKLLWAGLLALISVGVSAQAVDAEVRKVDKDARKITLKHGEIKNLDMPAMSMAFQVKESGGQRQLHGREAQWRLHDHDDRAQEVGRR